MGYWGIFVINCSFTFLKLSLEPFAKPAFVIWFLLHSNTTSLTPQTKSLQFIFLLKLKNLTDEAVTGKLQVRKSTVEECDWVFISRLGKYKSWTFVWRGARMASLVYGTSWNSSTPTQSKRSFKWETATANNQCSQLVVGCLGFIHMENMEPSHCTHPLLWCYRQTLRCVASGKRASMKPSDARDSFDFPWTRHLKVKFCILR